MIVGHIDTEKVGRVDYRTVLDWSLPDDADVDAYVAALVKRFEQEIRGILKERG